MTHISSNISDSFIAERVQQKANTLLFAEAMRTNILVIFGAIIVSVLFYSPDNIVILLSWSGLMIALAFIRFLIISLRGKRVQKHASVVFHEKLYFLTTVIIGFSWGIPSFFPGVLFDNFTLSAIMIIMLFSAYIASMALAMNLALLLCYITGFPLLLLLALATSSVLHASELIIMISFAWLSIAWMGRQQHKRIMNEFSLQVKNEELIRRLRNANLVAEQANQAKTDFLANMSHEIRTPMYGILGTTRLIMGMTEGGEQRRLLDNVLCSAESLLSILNDILDFSKIEAGQLSLEPHDFSLDKLLDNIVSSLFFQAADKNIFLKKTTNLPSVPLYIKADELRLRQILINLIGNAIKFTSQGGVTIAVDGIPKSEDSIALHFSITDTGIGIAPDRQKMIFSSFSQADNSTARKFGGTGLGLAISRKLVKMMGGTIGINSSEGQGSTFHFTIDVLMGKHDLESNPDPAIQPSTYSNLRILLVEDNKINQDVTKIVLVQDGQQVAVANDGLEALQLLANGTFDMILMDMQMPEMDGLTTTEIIRNCERNKTGNKEIPVDLEEKLIRSLQDKHLPVIAMTANVLERDRQKCMDAGMDDFLSKPFISEDLYKKLNKFAWPMKSHQAEVDSQQKTKRTPGGIIPAKTILYRKASTHLRNMYKLDAQNIEKLVGKAIRAIHDDLASLLDASSRRDLDKLHRTAHRLRGSLLNLGFEDLANQVQEIESMQSAQNGGMQNGVNDLISRVKDLDQEDTEPE